MFEMPTSLPEPASTKTKNGKGPYGQMQREVKTRWVLNPEAEAAGLPTVFVDLTTYHYGERKMYSSMLTWGTKEPAKEGSVFSVETWGSDHASWRPLSTPAARHSLKAMEAHHADALAEVARNWVACTEPVFFHAAHRCGLLVAEEV